MWQFRLKVSDFIDEIDDAFNQEKYLNNHSGRLRFTPTQEYKAEIIEHTRHSKDILDRAEKLYDEVANEFSNRVDEALSRPITNLANSSFDLARNGVTSTEIKEHPLVKANLLMWNAIAYLDIYDYLYPTNNDNEQTEST